MKEGGKRTFMTKKYESEPKRPDRRNEKTRRAIRQAFREIFAKKKDISKVSVKEVVEKADISKSTFYAHYRDIYAIIEDLENEMLDIINQTIDEYLINRDKQNKTDVYLNSLLASVDKNRSLFVLVFASNSQDHFISRLRRYLSKKINDNPNILIHWAEPRQKDAAISFLVNGMVYLIADFYRGTIKLDVQELGSFMNEIISRLE